jgi:hypothetical protein
LRRNCTAVDRSPLVSGSSVTGGIAHRGGDHALVTRSGFTPKKARQQGQPSPRGHGRTQLQRRVDHVERLESASRAADREIAVVEKPAEQRLIDIDALDLVHVHFDRTTTHARAAAGPDFELGSAASSVRTRCGRLPRARYANGRQPGA